MRVHLGSTPVNVLDVLFRNKEAVALYRGSTLLQSFGESSPKLQADFTTGTYKASGASKTFADLFTFTRAGKAWLVKDTGLQEYEADVPRFDDGLLIEQSATNMVSSSTINSEWVISYPQTGNTLKSPLSTKNLNEYIQPDSGFRTIRPPSMSFTASDRYVMRLVLKSTEQWVLINYENSIGVVGRIVVYDNLTAVSKNGWVVENVTSKDGWLYVDVSITPIVNATGYGVQFFCSTTGGTIYIAHLQFEKSNYASSYIPTTETPITRPADFLLNKITGTTVTGDWDSTLNLSIVAGNLVHSGYGRIRSLEIN